MRYLLLLSLLITTPVFADQVRTQVIIDDKVNGIDYQDAIYYDGEIAYQDAVMNGKHATERQARLDNFKHVLENPAPVVEPTKKELEDAKAQLVAQIAELDVKISEKSK